jgi:hypothetical protein
MPDRTLWTERRLTGTTLILGAVLFLIGAVMPLTDAKGNFIYSLPPQQWLRVIFDHPFLWQWANMLFISGVVVTVLGFVMLTSLLRDAGDRAFSLLGLIAFVFGAVLWVLIVAFRMSVDPWAAQEMIRTAMLPDFYVPLILWIHTLGVIYTVLVFLALGAYGGAVLSTRTLPRWIGWFAIVYSLAGLGLYAYSHDVPPLLHYLLPIVIGILLLLQRSQLPTRSHPEEEPMVDIKVAVNEGGIS